MGNTVYVHANMRKPEGKSYAYYATLMYGDVRGRTLLHSNICKLDNQSENTHHRALQCYVNALDLVYNHQSELIENGVTNVLLVLSEKTLGQWLKDVPPIKYRSTINRINKMYAFGGIREIKLDVGLASDEIKNRAYHFCSKEYLSRDSYNGTASIKYESIDI